MIGFDIGKIIILCYKHYAHYYSLFNKNNLNLSLNTALEVLLSILLEKSVPNTSTHITKRFSTCGYSKKLTTSSIVVVNTVSSLI